MSMVSHGSGPALRARAIAAGDTMHPEDRAESDAAVDRFTGRQKSGEGPSNNKSRYKCKTCDTTFGRESHLRRHEALHDSLKKRLNYRRAVKACSEY
jgi:uncharacterized Zn-finger protein